LSLPAATGVAHHTDKHALNSTIYALLLEATGANDVTYKRTSVHPWLKPASLKAPATKTGGDLLWSNVAMPLYASKTFKRTFKVSRRDGTEGKGVRL
jgi:hypothetical protein